MELIIIINCYAASDSIRDQSVQSDENILSNGTYDN